MRRRRNRRWFIWAPLGALFFEAAWWFINRKRPYVPMTLGASWASTCPYSSPASYVGRG